MIDIVLIIPLLVGLYSGYSKGLFVQLASLVGIIAAIFISLKFSGLVSDYLLSENIVNEKWVVVAGFALTFLGILFGIKILARFLRKSTRTLGLGFFEKLAGAALGALKMFLVTMTMLFFFNKMNRFIEVVPSESFEQSVVYNAYQSGFDILKIWWADLDLDYQDFDSNRANEVAQ
ncbi:MAG: CvpA family protein [Weeksellaceae bacterium]|nr:CvpA family protein [Weeksellaceae bacterium]